MKETISSATSRKMKNMGFLCALFVVISHVICWTHALPWTAEWFIFQGIADGVARIAVPYFFIASGFFLARHFDEEGWWLRETGKRLKSLGPPYVAWSLAAWLVSVLVSVAFDMAAHRPLAACLHLPRGNDWCVVFGLDLSTYPLNGPLWYVRCLFALVAASAALEWVAGKFGIPWLAGSFLFLLFCRCIPAGAWNTCLYHAALGLFYFSAGIALRKTPPGALPPGAAPLSGLLGLAFLAAKMAVAARGWPFTHVLMTIALPFLLFSTWQMVPGTAWPDGLTSCAFPVFLMHIPVIRLLEPLLLHAGLGKLPVACAELAAGVACSCAVAWFLRKRAPGMASVLFGGR